MNSSAVRSSVRAFRLVDLESLQASAGGMPPADDLPVLRAVVDTAEEPAKAVGLEQVIWPAPIGSGPAPQPELPGPQVQVRLKVHGPLPRLPQGQVVTLPVSLSARPLEYAGLWLRNALLMLLTLGLYAPWAQVRARRYFLRRTLVAGEALDDHANPWALLPRHLMVWGLAAGVVGSWVGSRLAGMVALSLALAVLPLLVYMNLSYRVAHMSWAGRRLRFDGRYEGVYRAMWAPLVSACLVAWLLMATLAWNRPGGWMAWGAVAALWAMVVPAFVWGYFQYRQHHLVLGPVRLMWKARRASMVMLFVRALAWFALASMMVVGVAAVVLAGVLVLRGRVSTQALFGVWLGVAWLVLAAVVPYLQARMQNLVWSKTGNRYLRFRSRLDVQAYVWLQLRHAVLVVLTLGLYWPWAVVAARRMRTEALQVWARVETDVLKANWAPRKRADRTKMAG